VPAFARIQGGYYYTIVVDITWYDFYFHNLLAEAHYIPGTNLFTDGYGLTNSNDMGCAPYAMGENPRQPLLRCIPGSAHTSGLPTAFKGVGYLYFP
jgi:hypothetical protein